MTLLTIRQFSKQENVPETALRRLVKTGQAPGFYAGSRFYINAERMRDMLDHANAADGREGESA